MEEMPAARKFDVVTLRAVDQMQAMTEVGRSRLKAEGHLVLMTGDQGEDGARFLIPERKGSFVVVQAEMASVPRGTTT